MAGKEFMFADYEESSAIKCTKKEKFLNKRNQVVPCQQLLDLIEVATMRRFAEIELMSDRIPDEITTLAFWHLLQKYDHGQQIFTTLKAHLKQRGVAMKQGTVIEASMI